MERRGFLGMLIGAVAAGVFPARSAPGPRPLKPQAWDDAPDIRALVDAELTRYFRGVGVGNLWLNTALPAGGARLKLKASGSTTVFTVVRPDGRVATLGPPRRLSGLRG